jgi:hypothetical protein
MRVTAPSGNFSATIGFDQFGEAASIDLRNSMWSLAHDAILD